jgi:hypothetical protein
MRQAEVGMIRRLVEWLKGKLKPTEKPDYDATEEPDEPDCADCPDYDDCTNPWICIATVEDY